MTPTNPYVFGSCVYVRKTGGGPVSRSPGLHGHGPRGLLYDELPDVLRTLTPFLIATVLVAVPLYWMRSAWTLPQMIGLLLLSYTFFVVLLTVLPRSGHPENVSDLRDGPRNHHTRRHLLLVSQEDPCRHS